MGASSMSDETDHDREVGVAAVLIGANIPWDAGRDLGRAVNALSPYDRFRLAARIVGDDPSYIIEVIDAHIPSLSDAAEATMDSLMALDNGINDWADFAVRTCSCGARIDGFYEYVDHLKARLRDAGLITDMGVQPGGGEQ